MCVWKADSRGNMAPSVQYRRKNTSITAAVFCGGPSHSTDALAQVRRSPGTITIPRVVHRSGRVGSDFAGQVEEGGGGGVLTQRTTGTEGVSGSLVNE